MKLLVRWASLAAAVWVAAKVVPGIHVHGGWKNFFWVALVFGLVNAIIGTLVRVLTFPAVILSLGLALVVINAAMLELTAHWIPSTLTLSNFWSAVLGAIIISVVSSLLSRFYEKHLKRDR
jgi:putative membrane protein